MTRDRTRPARPTPDPGVTFPDQIVHVMITAIDRDGNGIGTAAGVASADSGVGPIKVPFTAAGETVRARLWRRNTDGTDADLLDVITPAIDRVAPRCALFGQCAGCQVQHLAYPSQLAWKTAVVRDLAATVGLADGTADAIPSPRPFGYRSKITPHYDRPRADRPLAIGFLKAGRRHEVVDVHSCPLATDGINAHLPAFRAEIAASASDRRLGASFLIREGESGVTTDPDARVTERVGNLELEFYAREFFQNNPFLLPTLVRFVVDAAAASGAPFLVDTYSGSGLFALAGAARFNEVVGVEVSPGAVYAARDNAARNGIHNARFTATDAARIFAAIDHPGPQTAVIVDPPRKGCGDVFLSQLIAFGPSTIVYVSCNPETLFRDLAVLMRAGYATKVVQPFDMFPQTRHVECVAVLTRGVPTNQDVHKTRSGQEAGQEVRMQTPFEEAGQAEQHAEPGQRRRESQQHFLPRQGGNPE